MGRRQHEYTNVYLGEILKFCLKRIEPEKVLWTNEDTPTNTLLPEIVSILFEICSQFRKYPNCYNSGTMNSMIGLSLHPPAGIMLYKSAEIGPVLKPLYYCDILV